jgi:hypothetical protein
MAVELQTADLSFSQTLFRLVGFIGRTVTIVASGEGRAALVSSGVLRDGTGLIREDDASAGEALYFALEGGGGFFLHRHEFEGAEVESPESLRIDTAALTIRISTAV